MSWNSWSDAFDAYRARGMDLSDAAYRADEWARDHIPVCPLCNGKGRISQEKRNDYRKLVDH